VYAANASIPALRVGDSAPIYVCPELLLATDTGGKPCAETVTPSEFPFRSHAASNANRATLTVRFVHPSLIFF